MSVLQHDDMRPNMEMELLAGPINPLDQPLPTRVLAQEHVPPEAGKGEGMSVARDVVPLAGLTMRHG
jgi:hypothetical protein